MSFLSLKSRDIGIDLGTANILVTLNGKGIVYREPAVIAIENQTGNVIAIGNEAKEMLGRTPKEVSAIRPLKDGVIADFTATKLLLKKIMDKVCKKYNAVRPRVIVGVPSGITEVEERAVEETIIRAGAKEVYLIEEPMAAAIGAGIEIEQPSGNIIVDIGGGTTEVAVISLGGIVLSKLIKTGGSKLDDTICSIVRKKYNLVIGRRTAEQIKINLADAINASSSSYVAFGRNIVTGLPASKEISSELVFEAIQECLHSIIDSIKVILERTPPELAADIINTGVYLTGGSSLIQNIGQLITNETGLKINLDDEPEETVIRGIAEILSNNKLSELMYVPREKQYN